MSKGRGASSKAFPEASAKPTAAEATATVAEASKPTKSSGAAETSTSAAAEALAAGKNELEMSIVKDHLAMIVVITLTIGEQR